MVDIKAKTREFTVACAIIGVVVLALGTFIINAMSEDISTLRNCPPILLGLLQKAF